MPLRAVGKAFTAGWAGASERLSRLISGQPRSPLGAVLRVVSLSTKTFWETNAPSRAADLSFSSMFGLGPLIGIAMLIASKVFGQRNPHLAVDLLNRLITFIAPQLAQYESLENSSRVAVNPALVQLIDGFIRGANSNKAGVFGAVSLAVIVLFLFKAIEDAFNAIWGVRSGRSLPMRLMFYWLLLVLGSALLFLTVALLGEQAFVSVYVRNHPFGAQLVRFIRWSLPVSTFAVLTGVLALYYRTVPNASVRWSAAFWGAFAAAVLLTANNFLQFLYVRRVVLTKSLFGSLGLIPVLMLGLYVFWLLLLIGGHVSYAVQNLRVRASRLAWAELSAFERDRLTLNVFIALCRRFANGGSAASANELAQATGLPEQVVNESLGVIVALGYASSSAGVSNPIRFAIVRPLSEITLFGFKTAADRLGPVPAQLPRVDPVVEAFCEAVQDIGKQGFFQRPVADLLAGTPAPP